MGQTTRSKCRVPTSVSGFYWDDNTNGPNDTSAGFRVAKDKIGDSSVKLQFNQEETWTRALRHVLLALKILLKWTTSGNNG